ncbi:capsular polysaccharide synthesis protein [Streptococcus pneumoniae]|nr:capsular polysaccharide synthesis protein [Streptococcus pneumoniae]
MNISNKVWICWFQGEERPPELIRTCIQSMRTHFSWKRDYRTDRRKYK